MEEKVQWVMIFSSSALYEAEIFKGVLEEKGIEAIIINKKDSSYLFGEAELYVTTENALVAKQIISNTTLD